MDKCTYTLENAQTTWVLEKLYFFSKLGGEKACTQCIKSPLLLLLHHLNFLHRQSTVVRIGSKMSLCIWYIIFVVQTKSPITSEKRKSIVVLPSSASRKYCTHKYLICKTVTTVGWKEKCWPTTGSNDMPLFCDCMCTSRTANPDVYHT